MRRALGTGVLLLAMAAGCGHCGGARAPVGTLLDQLPATVEEVLYVPHPEKLGPKLQALSRYRFASLAATLTGAANAEEAWQALSGPLGVDVRSPQALREAGIALEHGIAWVRLARAAGGDEHRFLVLAPNDTGKLEGRIAELARRRGAADVRRPSPGLTLFAPTPQGSPTLALWLREGWAFVAGGADCSQLTAWAAPGQPPLGADARWNESLKKLAFDADAYFHSPRTELLDWPVGSVTAGVLLEPDGVRARVVLPSGLNPKVAEALVPKTAKDLSTALPEDAFAVVRFRGAAGGLAPVVRGVLPAGLHRALARMPEDVERAVLAQLQPGALAGFSLARHPPVGSVNPAGLRGVNPFRYVELTAAAPVQDAQKAANLLAHLPRFAPSVGARVEERTGPDGPTYLTTYAQGEGVDFALAGDTLLAGSPLGRLEAARARLREKGSARPPLWADPGLKAALEEPALAVVVDLRQLDRGLRAIPMSDWGVGGFAIRSVLFRWLDGLSELRGLALGITSKEPAAVAELSLRWTAP